MSSGKFAKAAEDAKRPARLGVLPSGERVKSICQVCG